MPRNKTSTLNLRISPNLKEAVKEAAMLEHRSVANFVEMLVRDHCKHHRITIPEQRPLFADEPEAN